MGDELLFVCFLPEQPGEHELKPICLFHVLNNLKMAFWCNKYNSPEHLCINWDPFQVQWKAIAFSPTFVYEYTMDLGSQLTNYFHICEQLL